MVVPTDIDVIFYLPENDPFAVNPEQHNNDNGDRDNNDSQEKKPLSTGNRIFQECLEQHLDAYNHTSGLSQDELVEWQKEIRKQVLETFHQRIHDATANGPLQFPGQAPLPTGTQQPQTLEATLPKAQFYVHIKQGDTSCFAKVCFKNRIDEKIKESFERLSRKQKRDPLLQRSTERLAAAASAEEAPASVGGSSDKGNDHGASQGATNGSDSENAEEASVIKNTTNGNSCENNGVNGSHSEASSTQSATARTRGLSHLPVPDIETEHPSVVRIQGDKGDKTKHTKAKDIRNTGSSGSHTGESALEPMPEITKSPYEGNQSAEIDEEQLDELKKLMEPWGPDRCRNPILDKYYGEPLASTIFRTRLEIPKTGLLYHASWIRGKIGDSNLGWIPKPQMLLCLMEEKFGSATDCTASALGGNNTVQAVAKKLECSQLVIRAMKEWNLKFEFPELYSNNAEKEFVFRTDTLETKTRCYKCEIFVARVYAAVVVLNQEAFQAVKPSLMTKVRACLAIMNEHVQANTTELVRIVAKKQKFRDGIAAAGAAAAAAATTTTTHASHRRRKRRLPESTKTAGPAAGAPRKRAAVEESALNDRPRERTPKRRRTYTIEGTCEEREEILTASYAIIQKEVEKLLMMMELFRQQLRDRPEVLSREIQEGLERENC